MALNLHLSYEYQVAVDAGYPYGKPRNVAVEGDGTGFPLEEQWTSDLYGFLQSLLVHRGITPNGVPDQVGASQYLQALLSTFIDAVDGGTYAPSAPIIIQGDFEVSGTGAQFTAGNHAAFLNGITVGGGTSFFIGDVDVTGEMDVDTLTVDGASAFVGVVFASGGMLVSGGMGIAGGLTVSTGATTLGNLNVSGLARFTGSGMSVEAPSSLQQPLVASVEGRVVDRAVASGVDDNLDISIEDGDAWWIADDGLSSDRIWTLLDDGALNGDEVEISMKDAGNTLTVRNEAFTPLVIVGSTSNRHTVRFRRILGAWRLVSAVAF